MTQFLVIPPGEDVACGESVEGVGDRVSGGRRDGGGVTWYQIRSCDYPDE